jgi:hypothetical protein
MEKLDVLGNPDIDPFEIRCRICQIRLNLVMHMRIKDEVAGGDKSSGAKKKRSSGKKSSATPRSQRSSNP